MPSNRAIESFADRISSTLVEVKAKLVVFNAKYKEDAHQR